MNNISFELNNTLSAKTAFTSCGCNRTPSSVHWLQDSQNENQAEEHGGGGLFLYAARNSVAVVLSERNGAPRVISSHSLHKDRVNCVRWLQKSTNSSQLCYFLSGGVDKALCLCKYHRKTREIESVCCFKDSQSSVICCDGLTLKSGQFLLASACGDSYVRIYQPDKDAEKALQSIKFGTGFILSLQLTFISATSVPMLACGGDDAKIHIFIQQAGQFVKAISLHGHEDWIRGLDFTTDDKGDMLLASCSQDCFVRIWRITESPNKVPDPSQNPSGEIKLKENVFVAEVNEKNVTFSVTVETVLYGHEGWVYGIHWHPKVLDASGTSRQPMKLLTASMDKTMIIWQPDADTGVWEERLRVGEVGGNTLGLYGCQFSAGGRTILAHGYHGAFTLWNLTTSSSGDEHWCRGIAVSGHFGDVTDIAWDPEGHFLLSTSFDQTTRLFAPWKETGNWYEMGRPQVHGYDLQCLAMLGRLSFASGADEKVVRVFQCPLNFLENLDKLCDAKISSELHQMKKEGRTMAEGASVPALGLSNKAVFADQPVDMYADKDVQPAANEQYTESSFRPLDLTVPPSEDNLLQNTLWPETQKLYGHGFEIFALAANPQGTILASACKATKPDYAGIILWDTKTWQQITTLYCHSLTVVQMAFSPVSGDRLLSVSRDRTWALHQFDYTSGAVDKLAATDKKTAVHSRIIWSCCWTPDEAFFLTASRDKKVIFWCRNEDSLGGGDQPAGLNGYGACSQATFSQSVTAVGVSYVLDSSRRYLLAAGLENGEITLCSWNKSEGLTQLHVLDTNMAHHLTVRKLIFRPNSNTSEGHTNNVVKLASCGQDHQVKLYDIMLTG